jgi:3-hydroxybutyryl-CoA dehydrogenase
MTTSNEQKHLVDPARVRKVAIIGGGTMGSGCAQVFAAAGYRVALQSRKAETLAKGMKRIRDDLAFLADRGVGRAEDIEATIARIEPTQGMEEALEGAGFMLECVYEDLALKQDIFAQMDEIVPPTTVLATNTSVMSITEIASKAKNRARIVGAHWWNPPSLIPLVEVVRHGEAADWAVDLTANLMTAVGKRPIVVQKDVPGFVANRLQHALMREAISIVERGIADAETVSEALKSGPGLRLPVISSLETADMGGLDLTLAIHSYIFKHLEDSHDPSPLLKEKVAKGELGFKSGGKGLRDWTPEQMRDLRDNLLDYLARVAASKSSGS